VATGRRRVVASPDALLAALRALGAGVDSPGGAEAAVRDRKRDLAAQVIEPVHVLWDGAAGAIPVRSPGRTLECVLRLETGETSEWTTPAGGPVALPPLPLGYHDLTLRTAGAEHSCFLISAPSRAYAPPGGLRAWGAFLPLYALRSRDDWGAGDFGGLRRLARFAGGLGASFVATLPLFAAFLDRPFDPSPYAPASRLFWNELYINVNEIPELQACPEARSLVASPGFRRELERLRNEPLVDYHGVMAAKRRVLSLLAGALAGPRLDAFLRFVEERPVLQDYARFRAAGERFGVPWPQWPASARRGHIQDADVDPAAVRYHQYVQWLSEEQLAGATAAASNAGVFFYFDLPLGASPDSYDVWRNQRLYASGASVGAPPDAFFVQGQDWCFPPPHPDAIRRERYASFIAVLRRALTFAGALRIDHVMGLHRLYLVPAGFPATQGVYVRYHAEEAYAILCLESHRRGALIVGEDLGTVPSYVKSCLARHNIYGMYITQYQVSGGDSPRLAPVPARSVAALNTHDMPPFAGWLQGADIDEAARLGFLGPEAARSARATRRSQRDALSRVLQDRGLAPTFPSPAGLAQGALRHLAGSRARMVLVNLEDLWLETRHQNIPGASGDAYPNWRRKAARSLEEIETNPRIAGLLRDLSASRIVPRTR